MELAQAGTKVVSPVPPPCCVFVSDQNGSISSEKDVALCATVRLFPGAPKAALDVPLLRGENLPVAPSCPGRIRLHVCSPFVLADKGSLLRINFRSGTRVDLVWERVVERKCSP